MPARTSPLPPPVVVGKRQKKAGRPKAEASLAHDDEGPSIKAAPDREGIKRLIKSSDMSPQEIASKMGCAVGYVYMLRHAMKRAGDIS